MTGAIEGVSGQQHASAVLYRRERTRSHFSGIWVVSVAVPLQASSFPEVSRKLCYRDIMAAAEEGGKLISLKQRPLLPKRNAPGTHFCYKLGLLQCHSAFGNILYQREIPMASAAIQRTTFRFVAHFKH